MHFSVKSTQASVKLLHMNTGIIDSSIETAINVGHSSSWSAYLSGPGCSSSFLSTSKASKPPTHTTSMLLGMGMHEQCCSDPTSVQPWYVRTC